MIDVIILGFGNVGSHLCTALGESHNISINQIYNRSKFKLSPEFDHIPITTKLSEIKNADVFIIAVSDDVIDTFSSSLPLKNKLVVHTSGSVALTRISDRNRRGVLYPLQTFSKDRSVDFKDIPICIEAENPEDLKTLKKIGQELSNKVVEINSEERGRLHLAAVFVNNFVNYLYSIGQDMLAIDELPFDLLRPLIIETAKKTETLAPNDAQTGPAFRNDKKTIEKHLHLLADSPHKRLYEYLTEVIQEKYNN